MRAVFVAFVAASALATTGCGNSPNRRNAADYFVPAAQGESPVLEVSFVFTRQGGIASNQFAVWIEDAQGGYVRTLYATRWTAAGGWRRRENSIPQWVRQSGVARRDQAYVDALARSTPRTGATRHVWDGRDYAGQAVSLGEFRVFVEASLRWYDRVVHLAVVRLGEAGQVIAEPEFFGDRTGERNMIGLVTVTVLP